MRTGYARQPDNGAESLRDPEIWMIRPRHNMIQKEKYYQIQVKREVVA
jgi:hypothetical protein